MSIMSAIVLLAVIWFMVLFVVLPLRLRTQGESGHVVPGTPSSAPDEAHIWRKVKLVTAVALVLWVLISSVIISGIITVEQIDFFGRMTPRV